MNWNARGRGVRIAAIVALCCSANGCDAVGKAAAEGIGHGVYEGTKPRLTEEGEEVRFEQPEGVQGCKRIGDEDVIYKSFFSDSTATMAFDMIVFARNAAPQMGGNAIVQTAKPHLKYNEANFDVFWCGPAGPE